MNWTPSTFRPTPCCWIACCRKRPWPSAIGGRTPRNSLAALLGLDEVAKTTVQSTLKEVTEDVARFELTGRVEGTIYGVSTTIEIKARYRFDLQTKRIDWVGMLVKEVREGSFVDGVDAVSRLAISITPVPAPASLADEALAGLTLKPTPELLDLMHQSPGGWRCTVRSPLVSAL